MNREHSHKDSRLFGTFYTVLLNLVLRRPLLIILITGALTILFGWRLPDLTFRTSVYDMVVDDLPEAVGYNAFKEVFGSDEIIRVVIKTDGVFTPQNFSKIEQVSVAAQGINGVRRVVSLPVIKKAVEISGEWTLEKFKAILEPITLFKKNLISDDHKTSVLTLILENNADKESVIRDINTIIDKAPEGLSMYQIGMPLVSQAMARFTEKDFMRLPPITILLAAIILWIIFRNLVGLIVPLGSVATALLWTLGLMGWLEVPLSMMTMVVPVFLIAVGTAYCLHIISTYLKIEPHAASPIQAVLQSYARITLPTFLAVGTTIIGLTSLLVNRIKAIHEFSLFASFGMLSLLVILFTAVPAVLVLLPRTKMQTSSRSGRYAGVHRLLEWIVRLNIKHRKTTLICIALFSLIFIIGIFFLRVETNPVGFFRANTKISRNFHDIYQDLCGSFPINVVLEADESDHFEDPANIAGLEELQQHLENLPGVDKSVSFADYIKLINYALNKYNPESYMIPRKGFELRMAINNYKSMLGQDMLSRFMNPDFSKTNILLFTHLSSSSDFLRTKDRILSHLETQFGEKLGWDVTGFGMTIAASSQLLTRGQIKSFSLTMIFIFVIMLTLFLSAKVACIAILPNAFPIVISFGMMGWGGIHLSMVTSMIASIAIGLAVDDSIHYLYRYNREFKKDLDKDRSLHDTILHVGRPILYTTLTIGVGFSVLLFSHFTPTSTFGLLMAITLIAAVIGDLVILPALMLQVELVTAWDLLKLMPTLSGISPTAGHELNQPLNVIKMGSEYLKMITQKENPIEKKHLAHVVNEIDTQVDRASEIIRRLMAFGQKPGFSREPIDVNQAVKSALTLVEHQFNIEDVTVEIDLLDSLPDIYGHHTKVSEVVFNLLTNACEAIVAKKSAAAGEPNEARITIRTFLDGKRVAVEVKDTGVGIPAHLIDRITEPFFTTKSSGRGKGLGLCISKEIVKDLGGRIETKSTAGQGACLKVTFPVYADLKKNGNHSTKD